jgi:hypothetical protein
VGERVEVHAGLGDRERVAARLGLHHSWVVEEGGGLRGRGELRAELAEGQVLRLLRDQPEGGDVPELGGPAVAEDHLVAVGSENSERSPLRSRPTWSRTGACRCEVPR